MPVGICQWFRVGWREESRLRIIYSILWCFGFDIIDRLDVTVMTWLFLLRLLVCSFFSFGDEYALS